MREAIQNFNKQFEFKPELVNADKLGNYKQFVVLGMGGSNLAATIIRNLKPSVNIRSHKGYGLPELEPQTLVIASSYSGNTEETLDGVNQAQSQGLPLAVISTGGLLLELAQTNNLPYIEIPNTHIQPRSALGFDVLATLKLIGETELISEVSKLTSLNPQDFEKQGKALAKNMQDHVPVIYASCNYSGLAYNWKIKLNETGKVPAFFNLLPELNHNEMTGFDVQKASRHLSQNFHFLFLKDSKGDHPRVVKRFEVLEKLYKDRGLRVEVLELQGASTAEKIFSSLILADWTALHTAEIYGHESEQVPMVEEFKKLI